MPEDLAPEYLEVSLPVTPDYLEGVSNYIIENICGGLVLEDEDDSDVTIIRFYVAPDTDVDKLLEGLGCYLKSLELDHLFEQIKKRRIRDIDWLESYRESVHPIFIGESIVIKTPWHEEKYAGKTEIIIEPKMAFGTGHHETTRSCLAVMENVSCVDKKVLDLGCGSGLLGIYAALKGASSVIGYDTDPLAITECRENYQTNGVGQVCRVELGSIDNIKPDQRFDLVLVNIIKETILPILSRLREMTAPGGVIIISGLMRVAAGEIEEALSANNLTQYIRHLDNEWITYRIELP